MAKMDISADDVGKWLPLLGALVALKILPGKWKGALLVLGAAVAIWKVVEES
jgi:hypothetical protein